MHVRNRGFRISKYEGREATDRYGPARRTVTEVEFLDPRAAVEVEPVPGIEAFELLEESERHWRADPRAALRCDGTTDSRGRRRLVMEALAAYEELRAREAPHTDPLTVFTRWPVCTVAGLLSWAATAPDEAGLRARLARPAGGGGGGRQAWLRGWHAAWALLVEDHTVRPAADLLARAPGLRLLVGTDEVGVTVPELRLNPATGALSVRFAGRAEDAWTVHIDGSPGRVSGDRAVVAAPARTVDCRHWTGPTHSLALVDPADPLVVFDEDGALIAPADALPAGGLWLLHPGEPVDAAFQGGRHVLQETPPPAGWASWWLGRVSVRTGDAIRSHVVGRDGVPVAGPWRTVTGAGGATLRTEPPVDGLVDSLGNPVYAHAPRLLLPPGDGVWTIDVELLDGKEPFTATATHPGGSFDVAALIPRPFLGRFRVRARRPGGRGISREISLAQGVDVRCEPTVRLFRGTGRLDPADVEVSTPEGIHADHESVHLDGRHTVADIVLSRHVPVVDVNNATDVDDPDDAGDAGDVADMNGGVVEGSSGGPACDFPIELTVRVGPAHMAVRKRTATGTGPWGVTPITFTPGELLAHARLDVLVPTLAAEALDVAPRLIAGYGPESPIQDVPFTSRRASGVLHAGLDALTDTVRTHGELDVSLDLPGRSTVVARVRDEPAAVSARCDGTRVVLLGRRRDAPLTVLAHSVLAPWMIPQRVELGEHDDAFVLMPRLRGAGPLALTVWQAHPGDASGQRGVDAVVLAVSAGDGVPATDDPVERAVVEHLSGRADAPTDAAALPFLWVAAARPGPVTRPDAPMRCAERLGADPERALWAAAAAGAAPHGSIVPLIRSGLAAHRFREVSDPGRVIELWASAPSAALLLTSPLLPYLTRDPVWDPLELEPAETDLLREVGRRCGPIALSLLSGAPLPAPQDSGFGPHPERMEALPAGQVAAIVRSMNPVPGWPLDADSRFLAMLAAFTARDAFREGPYDLPEYLDAIRAFVAGPERRALREAIERRGVPERPARRDRWQVVPALSLGCALVARQAAKDGGAASSLERRLRGAWAHVAEFAPDLAAQDLQLAEFTVTGSPPDA